jgi:molecular chaperone DnaJ
VAAKRDYYEVLGITQSATDIEIKRAFRSRARQYHPDVNKETGAEGLFKEINEAYEVLSDGNKRAAYDRFGHAGVNGGPQQAYAGFDSFADIFDQFFGAGGRRGHRGPQRGSDLRYDLSIAFEEAVFGAEKELEIPALRGCSRCGGSGAEPKSGETVCPSCHGSGEIRRVQQSVFGQFVNVVMCDRCQGEGRVPGEPCVKCNGQGRERSSHTVAVKIPAGVDNGQQIRLTGEGEAGPKGGPAGDLYVVLDVAEHPLFQRNGNQIQYDLGITVAQAALGAEVDVPTLDGDEAIKIPAGTQSGQTIRLRAKGVPFLRGSGRGDMYVQVRVSVPTRLTNEQRALFQQLAESLEVEDEHDKSFFGRVKEAFGG